MKVRDRTAPAVLAVCLGGLPLAALQFRLALHAGWGPLLVVLPLTGLMLLQWLRPLILFWGEQSEAVSLNDGLFLLLLAVAPPASAVTCAVASVACAQLLRRRPLHKALFNIGETVLSSSAGAAVAVALHGISPSFLHTSLLGCVAGTLVAAVLNNLLISWVVSRAEGCPLLSQVRQDVAIRGLIMGAGVVPGVAAALASLHDPRGGLVFILPLLVLRLVMHGHFRAHHDHARLNGLFQITLDLTRRSDPAEVRLALAAAAAELLHAPHAELAGSDLDRFEIASPVETTREELGLTPRPGPDRYDRSDRALLDALAAVGGAALSNAERLHDLQVERERLQTIAAALGEGVCALDLDGRVTFANPAAASLLGSTPNRLIAGLDRPPALEALGRQCAAVARTAGVLRDEHLLLLRSDGSQVPVALTCTPLLENGTVVGAVAALRDMTERQAFEQRLSHQAFHDALTGLPNRRIFLDRLEQALRRNRRGRSLHAVLFADVDRFKHANDNLGHQAGDQLLIAIAQRLSGLLRPGDTLARFGGDEFTLLVEDLDGPEDADRLAERVCEALRPPVRLEDGREVVASASVGVATTLGKRFADDVLHDADVAMYQAKSRGPGHWVRFDAAMGARSAERLDLEAGLRRALESGEMEVYYQPLVAADTRRPLGAEALVRWRHPERGLLAPLDFIGIAEDTGLVLPLGRHVLRTACAQAARWSRQTGLPIEVSVNLSARQFSDPDLVEEVDSALRSCGLDPDQLCLEITESLAVQDVEHSVLVLGSLKALGVRLAIDDFGTGYSSLTYLKRFPIDVIKVDRSFVAELVSDPVNGAIVAAVLALARAVGTSAVAEGVETEAQLDRLIELGCPVVQGYYLARPGPAEDTTELLRRYHGPVPPLLSLVR